MEACKSIPDARVYVTQSTHKTMVAFRQGSMILIRDPRFAEVEASFGEALFTHTTTSPNYSIIASLDAGRMWADLDGDRICNGAWRIAEEIRRQLSEDAAIAHAFAVMQGDELLAGTEESSMALDATKITLYLKHRHVTGRQVNAMLLAEEDVQFNKFTNNTVLLMVTPGTTESAAAHLVVALRRLSERLAEGGNPAGQERRGLSAEVLEVDCIFRPDFDLRSAYFGQAPAGLSLRELSLAELSAELERVGEAGECTSAGFVIPYPPGFPILVPGQVLTAAAIRYLRDLDSREVHGMPNRDRLRVWLRSDGNAPGRATDPG
jgi:arginine decarboxylase